MQPVETTADYRHKCNKGTLTIFYGWRVLRRAGIRSDKKKKLTIQLFFISCSDKPYNCPPIMYFTWEKHVKNAQKLTFFPPTWTCEHILFFIFFFPTSQTIPCRDPSTVEYSECALRRIMDRQVMVQTGELGQTEIHKQTDKRMAPNALSPCFAVNN